MQLPTAELEAAWRDALGETDPMLEASQGAEEVAGGERLAQLVQQRVKRIAERAYWDSVQVSEGTCAAVSCSHAAMQ